LLAWVQTACEAVFGRRKDLSPEQRFDLAEVACLAVRLLDYNAPLCIRGTNAQTCCGIDHGTSRGISSDSRLRLLAPWSCARAQLAPCYAGFEISAECITNRGLDQKADVYRAQDRRSDDELGRELSVLRLINNPVEAGYDAAMIGDVFTEVVRNEEMRNQSFSLM
jgi:hypothetical protein